MSDLPPPPPPPSGEGMPPPPESFPPPSPAPAPPPPPPPPNPGDLPAHAPTPKYTGLQASPTGGSTGTGQQANPLAITSMVLGILSIVVCWCFGIGAILAIGALATGFIGRNQIREAGGLQKGDGMALAGIITGGVGILFTIAYLVIFAIS